MLPERFLMPYKCTLNEEFQRKARDELGEVVATRLDEVQRLRQWLLKQPHIISRTDDRFLLRFLRGSKFSQQRAKEKLEQFHTLLTHCPEQLLFKDPLEAEVQRALAAGCFVPMPQLLPSGAGLVVVRVARRDPELVSQDCMLLVANMVSMLWQEQREELQVSGVVGLFDVADATLAHATAMTPTRVKKAVSIWDAQPVRQRGTHYINMPPYADQVINLFKMFMNEKQRRRISVHGQDRRTLHAALPPACLPAEYGGQLKNVDHYAQQWKQQMEQHRDFFLTGQEYGVDEKLRPGRPKTSADVFGIEGSFRRLEID